MTWNIVPECISVVFLCIIWIYSRKGNLIPNIKNKLFQISFLTTFLSITTNVLSTILIYSLYENTVLITWIVTSIYFIATPLMGLVYFFYVLANIYEDDDKIKWYFIVSGIPGLAYFAIILLNPFTNSVFSLDFQNGYKQGPLIEITYIIFYLYCVACVFLVAAAGKRVSPSIRSILFTFPIIAGLVIIIQQIYPSIILSGSAATSALLILYLYLQNKQIAIDHLTNLPKRHELLKMLDIYIKKQQNFSVIVLSLREFKEINDTHGQASGDELLVSLSNYLKKSLGLREKEIYRYSGDEFALLLTNGGKPEIQTISQKLLDRMAQAWSVSACTCLLSCAIGVVNFPKTSTDAAGLINGLEYAVRRAKKDKENLNVCYCTPDMLETFKRRYIIAEELESCLNNNGFELHYQPIYTVDTKGFTKAEALLRMNSAKLGRVSPNEFIPIAEETGIIIDITYFVLDKVCRFTRGLLDSGLEIDCINVNFSPLQFSQTNLLQKTIEIFDKYSLPYNKIKIEITESALIENPDAVASYLKEFNRLGVLIGLDDFGTGYSNFITVLNLPIDTIKLDKSLVWSAMKYPRCAIAVQNFTRAFCELDMTVLAEGVETPEQSSFVVDAGCSLIQGFLYSQPLPEREFIEFIRANQQKNL